MLAQTVRDPLSLLPPNPSVDGPCLSRYALSRVKQKRQERWEEAVNSIDFLHSGRKAWSTVSKLTGRSGPSSRLCPVSAMSHLVKNAAHNTGSREPTRLTNKELSDLWKVPTPEGSSISGYFRPEELAVALRRLKSRKSPGLDSIFPEFILHAGSALKSLLCDFITYCLRQLKILDLEKSTNRSLNLKSHWGTQRRIALYTWCVSPTRSSKDSSTLVSNQSSTHYSHRNKRAFETGSRPQIRSVRSPCWYRTSRIAYDTVWHRGLTSKLLRLLPDSPHDHGDGWQSQLNPHHRKWQRSRLQRLKNGVPRGSVLSPLLFNIYISDMPNTISSKYAYADDLC